jgi:hypothetical protein
MRVLVLGWNSLLDEGNFAVRAARVFSNWLTEAGHEVTALTSAYAAGYHGYSLPDLIKKNGVIGGGRFLPQSLMVAMFPVGGWRAQVLCTAVQGKVTTVDLRAYESHVQRVLRDVRPHLTISFDFSEKMQGPLRLVRQAGCPVLGVVDSTKYDQKSLFQHLSRVLCLSPELATFYTSSLGMRSAGFPAPSGTAPDVLASSEITILDPDQDAFYVDLQERLSVIAPVKVCSSSEVMTDLHPTSEQPLTTGLGILLQSPHVRQCWMESFSRAGVPLMTPEVVVSKVQPKSREEWVDAWVSEATRLIQDQSARNALVQSQQELVARLFNPETQIPAYIRFAESMVQPGVIGRVSG